MEGHERRTVWKTVLAWIFLWTICQRNSVDAKTHFKYMTNYCSKTLEVNNSLLMALTPQHHIPESREQRDFIHCDVDLKAPKGMQLFAHFLQLGISPVITHTDSVQIFDMLPKKKNLTPLKGLYGKLDRSLFMFDDSGSEIDDYWTSSNMMRLDYLGKPTRKSPGFRVLITAFYVAETGGACPAKHYLCKGRSMCIPRQMTCDGYFNCGKDDTGDEEGCDRDDTVTDLLAEYSLTKDIIVVILLPLVIFILIVIIIFLLAKRYIRQKITKPIPPPVSYRPKDGERVIIGQDQEMTAMYAPPAYEEVINPPSQYGPPPAYSRLASMVRAGSIEVMNSDDEVRASHLANERRRRHERRLNNPLTDSTSSIEERTGDERHIQRGHLGTSEYENYRLHQVWPSDTDDDEDMKEKRKRKGGKHKSKGKKRADGVGGAKSSRTEPPRNGSLHGISPLASPGTNSAHSVNSPSSGHNDDTADADSSNPSASSPDLPPASGLSPGNITTSHQRPYTKPTTKDTTSAFIPIHNNPTKTSSVMTPYEVETNADCHNSETSSSIEGGQKSETESRCTSKPNSHTESIASLKDVSCSPVRQNGNSEMSDSEEDFHKKQINDAQFGKPGKGSKDAECNEDADVSSDSDGHSAIDKLKGKQLSKVPATKTAKKPVELV